MLYVGMDMLLLGLYGLVLVAVYLIAKNIFKMKPDADTAAVMIVTILFMLLGYAIIMNVLEAVFG